MIYYASQFTDRVDLDLAMANRVKEDGEVIVGTLEDFNKLGLSTSVTVYGVPCRVE